MACDVQTLENLLTADGFAALSDHDFLICLAGAFLAVSGIDAQTAVTNAAANGYQKLSDLELDQALLAVFTATSYDAQSIVNTIGTQKDDALDRRDLLLAQVAAYCAGTMTTAQAIENLLTSNGYRAFCQFDALRALLAVCSSSPLIGALDWAARVVQNGGAMPSAATITAVQTFLTSISSIQSKLYHVGIFAPDSLIALRTPLINVYGSALWQAGLLTGAGTQVFSVNGWGSTGNSGTDGTIYDTGVNPALIPNFNIGNGGMTIYAPQSAVAMPIAANAVAGALDAAPSVIAINPRTGITLSQGFVWSTTGASVAAPATRGGIFSANRTAANSLNLYFANSGVAWSSIASSAVVNATAPTNLTLSVGGENKLGVYNFVAQVLSFFAVHDGLSSADGQTLFNAVQALRTAFGGGFL